MKSIMKFKLLGFGVIFTIILFSSWKNATVTTLALNNQKLANKPVMLQGDVLVFNTANDFSTLLQQMKADQQNLVNFEAQYPGFNSMSTAYEAITEAQQESISASGNIAGYEDFLTLIPDDESIGDFEAEPNVQGEILPHVVNHEGLVVVGGFAYKYTFDKVFKTQAANIETLKNTPITDLSSVRGVETSYVIKGCTQNKKCVNNYEINNIKRRIRGYATAFKSGDYEEINVSIKHQRRLAGIWWRAKVARLEVVGDGTYFKAGNTPCQSCPFSTNGGLNNSSSYAYIIDNWTNSNPSMLYCFVTCHTQHKVKGPDGVWRTCNISIN